MGSVKIKGVSQGHEWRTLPNSMMSLLQVEASSA